MGKINTIYDLPNDPFATTVDDISEYYHVQSVSAGGSYLDITAPAAANYPVVTPTRYFVSLPQRIDISDLTGSRPCTITDNTSTTTLTRVTGAVGANQYRIAPDTSRRRDIIEIHSGQANHVLKYDYYGMGSVLNSAELNTWREFLIDQNTITADYTITDTDGYRDILANHSSATGKIAVTLPTVADNTKRRIRIQNIGEGYTLIDGEGSEKISLCGTSVDNVILLDEDDYIELLSNGSEWKILSYNFTLDTGNINQSDWTALKAGNGFTYDTKSTAVSWTGKKITEATSGNTATIIYDNNSTGVAGIFYFSHVTGDGIFTNNRVLTSNDGLTAAVDEASGSSKNIEYNIYHGLGISHIYFEKGVFISEDKTEALTYDQGILNTYLGGDTVRGASFIGVDLNSMLYYIYTEGLGVLRVDGSSVLVDSEDWYRKEIIKIRS